MWTKILNGTENGHHVKYRRRNKDDGYDFFLTDFVRIWKSSCDRRSLEKLLRDQNPLLGGDDSSLLNGAVELLFEGLSNENTKSTLRIDEDGRLRADFAVSNDDYALKLPLSFESAQPETYCEEITKPLIDEIVKRRESENSLTSLLSKKDIEISEYKAEGARLSSKHYETEKFDPAKHKENYRFNENFFQILPDVNSFLNVKLGISDKIEEINNGDESKMKKTTTSEKNVKIKNEIKIEPYPRRSRERVPEKPWSDGSRKRAGNDSQKSESKTGSKRGRKNELNF